MMIRRPIRPLLLQMQFNQTEARHKRAIIRRERHRFYRRAMLRLRRALGNRRKPIGDVRT